MSVSSAAFCDDAAEVAAEVAPDYAADYGYVRAAARLATRPDERTWRQLRAARSLLAAVDLLRASSAAPCVAAVTAGSGVDVEPALRQHLRLRIRETASWAPPLWREALRFTEVLLDLPALQLLLTEPVLPDWLHAEPRLAAYAAPDLPSRRARLAASPLAPFAAAVEAAGCLPPARRGSQRLLHPLLELWCERWVRTWPPCPAAEREALQRLLRTVRAHVEAFAELPLDAADSSREHLAERLRRQMHDAAAQPAALFAYLLLLALDLERLRGELTLLATGRSIDAEVLP